MRINAIRTPEVINKNKFSRFKFEAAEKAWVGGTALQSQ